MTKRIMKGFLKLGSVVLVLAVSFNALRAEEKPSLDSSHVRIVLVGISNYADKQIKSRRHPEDDDLFTDKKYLGLDGV